MSMRPFLATVAVLGMLVPSFGGDVRFAGGNLQTALDAGAGGCVVIAKGVWEVDPALVRNETEVVFEPGAELVANPRGFFGINDCVLTVRAQTNVTIRGGTIRMHRKDYLAKRDGRPRSQWRHCVNLRGAVGVRVEHMRFFEAGGDGVYVANDGENPSRNVTVRSCFCDRPLRQSMSVIDVEGLLIEGCTFRRALGENPQCGIDFEPNHSRQRLQGIVVRDCLFEGNARRGINLHLSALNGSSPPVDFLIEGCTAVSNTTGFGMCMNARDRFVKGRVVVSNCVFRANSEQGIDISQKPLEGARLEFHDVTVEDSCRATPLRGDIQMLTRYPWDMPLDGIVFDRITVRQTREGPWIAVKNASRRRVAAKSFDGNVVVVHPDGSIERAALGEKWAAKALPPAPGVEMLPVSDWRVPVPSAPDAMCRYEALYMRGWLHFPFHADAARKIHFVCGLRRAERVGDRVSDIAIRQLEGGGRKLLSVHPTVQGGGIVFNAPAAGWYVLSVKTGSNGFSVTGCNAPVYLSLGAAREFDAASPCVVLISN